MAQENNYLELNYTHGDYRKGVHDSTNHCEKNKRRDCLDATIATTIGTLQELLCLMLVEASYKL
jgi:hypothetical protein